MKKLLIIESSTAIAAGLKKRLAGKCHVYICCSRVDAMAQIQTLHPDILFLDLTLPPNGFDLLGQISFCPPVRIARTNIITDDIIARAQSAGIHALFPTPCSIQALADHICQYI